MNKRFFKLLLVVLLVSHSLAKAGEQPNITSTSSMSQSHSLASRYLIPVSYPASIRELDGEWYSPEWKYGYRLNNGVGTATYSNSPNFRPGDRIIFLTTLGIGSYTGRQVYRDGNFYSIQATLYNDRLCFEGERNVNWCMVRIGR
jgi:hypothetical protein